MTPRGRTVVYAGPTLPEARLRDLLPSALVRPPAGRGDLLAERWSRGDVALVIDGYFRERRSVGHKEILTLLDEGVRVVGAASMGALRAAELAPFGMVGLGAVYRMYADGEIDGDDEVGVLHGPAERGYPAQTAALVSVRFAARAAVHGGLIAPERCDRIVAATKAMPFVYRTWADIEHAVDQTDREAVHTLRAGIENGTWDVKRRDAESAARAIASGGIGSTTSAPRSVVTRIGRTQRLERGSREQYAPQRWLSDLDVLDAARLFDPDYPQHHEQVLTGLVDELAGQAGATRSAFALAALGVNGHEPLPEQLGRWLDDTELAELSAAEQALRVMVRVWPVWHCLDWRPAVLAHLRGTGRWNGWRQVVIDAAEVRAETQYRLTMPPPAVCGQLFLRHWGGTGSSPRVELGRRGFTSADSLGETVRPFFAYDVRRGRRPIATTA